MLTITCVFRWVGLCVSVWCESLLVPAPSPTHVSADETAPALLSACLPDPAFHPACLPPCHHQHLFPFVSAHHPQPSGYSAEADRAAATRPALCA